MSERDDHVFAVWASLVDQAMERNALPVVAIVVRGAESEISGGRRVRQIFFDALFVPNLFLTEAERGEIARLMAPVSAYIEPRLRERIEGDDR